MNQPGTIPSIGLRVLSALCFAGLLPLGALAFARIFRVEDSAVVILAQTFTPYVFIPAYIVFAFAVLARRRVLGLSAVFLVICHLVWVFPEYQPAREVPDRVASAPTIKVFSQNLKYDNPTPGAVAKTIRDNDADLVLLQELTPAANRLLHKDGAFDDYPHEFFTFGHGPVGMGMWSKIPFESTRLVDDFALPAIRVTLTAHEEQLVVWNVHMRSPPIEGGSIRGWQDDLRSVKAMLHGETGNVIAAGDFNSVWSHRPYREIVDDGYLDAHIDRGRGYARTWPAGEEPFARWGGVIRIDHLLTRGSVRASTIKETPAFGSDHRGLVATIAVW